MHSVLLTHLKYGISKIIESLFILPSLFVAVLEEERQIIAQ